VTTDLTRRLREHNGDGPNGSRYTRSRRPVVLMYQEQYGSRSDACKREYQIKQMTARKKTDLIKGTFKN